MAGANLKVKEQEVKNFKTTLGPVQTAVVGQCTGIDVESITILRKKIRATGANFKIVKNTLAYLAVEGTELDSLKDHFKGPTAIAFTGGDPVAMAKVLADFSKGQEKFQIRAGVLNGAVLSAKDVVALANVPSREVLLSEMLGSMQSPYANFVYVLSEILRKRVEAL